MNKIFVKFMHALSVLLPFFYIFYIIIDGVAISGKFTASSLGEFISKAGINIQAPNLEDNWYTLYSIYYLMMSTPLFVWMLIVFVPIAIITYNKMDGY